MLRRRALASQPHDDQLVQDLLGCCHFTSTMVDMIRSQFGDSLEESLEPTQFEALDRALRAVLLRVDSGINSARVALASGRLEQLPVAR